jgi:hypothetical protein
MATQSSPSLPEAKPLVAGAPLAGDGNGHAAPQAAVMAAEAEPVDEEELEEETHPHQGRFMMLLAVPSWLVSMVFHIIVLILLALMSMPMPTKKPPPTLEVGTNEELEELEEFDQPIDIPEIQENVVTSDVSAVAVTADIPTTPVENLSPAQDIDAQAVQIDLSDFGERTAPKNDLLASMGAVAGHGFQGRGQAKAGMVQASGGSPGSEEAVARALKWLAYHQLPNGSWSFDHTFGADKPRLSPNPGTLKEGYNGATAMALLPFLGAGHTHMEGDYKKTVQGGLYYLMNSAKTQNRGGMMTASYEESGGSMYSHGLCSIVLCEAYGMTQDRGLMQPAQLAVNHIMYAQDPVGGGWRYAPRQPGDTSVVGWQIMALKSAHMAYLFVDPNTVRGASNFLDIVQSDSGAKYGYTDPGGGQATTAVGLLCRMYLGWKRDHPGLERGAQWISNLGPSLNDRSANMYYNYYATQVMRQYGGEKGDPQWEMWEKWNEKMRDPLVAMQSKEGPTEGSWYFHGGDHGTERGGRLYCTSMATMMLEVYYRHMPIYQRQATEEDFPL